MVVVVEEGEEEGIEVVMATWGFFSIFSFPFLFLLVSLFGLWNW